MEINNLLNEAASEFKVLQTEAKKLAEKWKTYGLLEGLETEQEQLGMAMLLENQTKRIVVEQSQTGTGGTFTPGVGAQWAGVALPLVRKVFAEIAAKDFVSIQPMNLPSGLVFYLDFKYGTSTGGFNSSDSLYGNVSNADSDGGKMAVDEEVSGGLYGAGRFGYSINTASAALQTTFTAATSASVGYETGLNPSEFSVVSLSLAGTEFDSQGVRAFRVLSGSTDVTSNPEFTTVTGNAVSFVITGSVLAQRTNVTGSVVYHKQPNDNSRGDFEDRTGTLKIPEIDINMASEAIVAKTRKLKAKWTPEFQQDLNAYQSVDAEAEVTSIISEYISMEIDLEILDMLIQNAVTTERWSATTNRFWNNATGKWEDKAAGAGGYYNTQGQWYQTIGTKMQKVSNKIHQKTLRGGANFAVCSPTVATILESIPGYAASTDGDKMDFAMGVQKVGTINSRFKVYKNPYMTENILLLGYRGSQFLETGAVYAPYIPLMMTPLVMDPETFTPRKGVMTRYAKKMVRPEFYGKIFVTDLETV